MTDSIVICEPLRTPVGSFQGSLATVSAPDLGAAVVKKILEKTKINPEKISDLIAGCVLTSGVGQAPARQVALKSGLPISVQAMTINKVCSSGLKAVQLAVMQIQAGHSEAVIAGGMESMSKAPYLSHAMRTGARLGHTQFEDAILADGLLDAFDKKHMGLCAELCAKERGFSRDAQDAFAEQSYRKAQHAIEAGYFKEQIVSVDVAAGKKSVTVSVDEEPSRVDFEKLKTLRPVFDPAGSVTAANASTINDGAAFMIVCKESFALREGLKPVAKVLSVGWGACEPQWFTVAPVGALTHAAKLAQCSLTDIDLFEINEAFSVVALACRDELKIPDEKLNVTGGAVAIGHPIGASGARILTTLIHNLTRLNKKRGAVGICNGGGEATSIIVERF